MFHSKTIYCLISAAFLFSSCSVISTDIRYESNTDIRFGDVSRHPERYEGETVILGGYIIKTQDGLESSILTVLQAPLAPGDSPKSRDYSEGRFTVVYDGFLDPEVYRKDRKITVAGRILRCKEAGKQDCHTPYLKIQSRELYLWPEYEYGYYHNDHYAYPYRYRMHRFHRHGFFFPSRYRYCL